jgi:periplasmic protein CpxP/Spy
MKNRIAAVAAMVALTGTLAFAAPHGGGRGHFGKGKGRQGHFAGLAQKLNLTDAQKELIKKIHADTREQNKAFFQTARENRKAAHEARKANDTARLASLETALQADRERMKAIRQAEMQQVLNVLTAEQRAQYETLKAEREARRGERGNKDRKPRH